MPISESIELDISQALGRVDDIGTALSNVVSTFSSELSTVLGDITVPPIEVPVDETAITAGIDDAVAAADTTVPIEADASSIPVEIDAAVGEVGPVTIDVDVTGTEQLADLSAQAADASTQVGGLDAAAQGAGASELDAAGAAENLADQTGAISAAAGLASGDLTSVAGIAGTAGGAMNSAADGVAVLASQLGVALPGAAKAGIAAIASVAAAAGILGAFTDLVVGKAAEAQSATERFNLTLGDQAEVVNKVNIGGLNEDLSTLALRLGSDDDAIRQADASLFQLGKSSQASSTNIAATVEQVNALAARAVALNPELGQVGANIDGLSAALGRGGKPLAAFNISLTANEINARASADAGGKAADQLTVYEKRAAGAALATEKLGKSLSTDIDAGAKNVAFSFSSLKQGFEEVLETLGAPLISPTLELLRSAIPIGVDIAKALAAAARAVLPLIGKMVSALQPLIKIVADGLVKTFDDLGPTLEFAGQILADTLGSPAAIGAFADLAQAADDMLKAIEPLIPLMVQVTANSIIVGVEALAIAFESVAVVMGPVVSGLEAIGVIQPQVARSTTVHKKSQDDLAESLLKAGSATFDLEKASTQLLGVIDAQAQKFQEINAATKIGADGFSFLALGINDLRGQSDADLSALAARLGLNVDDFKTWKDEVLKTIDGLVADTKASLPKIADAFTFEGIQLVDPATITRQLQGQAKKVEDFQKNVEELHRRGLDNLVAEVLREGPIVGSALAESIVKGDPAAAAALEAQLQITRQRFDALVAYVQNTFGPQFAAATGIAATQASTTFGISLDTILPKASVTGALAADQLATGFVEGIDGKSAQVYASSFKLGQQVTRGFNDGVDSLGGNDAVEKMTKGATSLAEKILGVKSPSTVFARIGGFVAEGFALGMTDANAAVIAAAEQIVRDAAKAASDQPLAFTPNLAPEPAQGNTGANAGALGGASGLAIGQVTVAVTIPAGMTPADGELVGAAIGRGLLDQITTEALIS